MDSDQGKLFIGGISWETSEDKLKEYFSVYGDILQAVVMRDKITGRPRGFGFVVFSDPSVLDSVLQEKHTIDGRTVEAKRALSREEQQVSKAGNPSGGRNSGGSDSGNMRTKKIFVGGLPATLSEEGFRQYFEAYGNVTDVVVMYDQQTNRPRGFGFISFDSEEAVDRVLHKTFHDLNGKQVEVKRALPKDANPGGGGGRSMGGGGGGGGYQGYGASGGNSSYEGRMDSNRYMQSQTAGGGGYGGSDGSYGNPAGYGAVGGRVGSGPNSNSTAGGDMQSGGGYMGSGYGDANGNAGYGNSGWRGDPSQASGNYGGQGNGGQGGGYGGYGGAPARQG
ncbi:putative RNA recognition motif domain, nucleotide-binding alpha-beta plait domain superfamily [Helianthus annuus]|nr:putative RNA recognition motif domain, nucleotide-binding alpha-beta plait domain superfamily [Helianthus annuus]KAJ0620267.1 putative RNA recognition motif domain, nucleotide-binding alpha-beta plait domain superfamily [Helianthus annuus]KAJ0778718.1 putative RNA recognition motif domain, nucleotide-binding alpha-beta plait domain superfamily [Helianthus annuus]